MSRRRTLIVLAVLVTAVPAASAQETTLPGRLVTRDAAPGDTTQHVAAYFPSRHDSTRRAPVLFVLDPRGRGLLALRLFAGAAERHGWIVVSSYNSASDSTIDPNLDAMNAMLAWAQAHARMDTTRLYLAGFSGTARIAWALAAELRGSVAGIFGAGGAVSSSAGGPEMTFGGDSTFAFFGSAGLGDFNYVEMRDFATRLRVARIPSRMRWFAGPHAWPPRWLCEEGVDWLELRAMLGGRRAPDSSIAHVIRRDVQRADSLERAGQWDAAETRFREISLDVPDTPAGRAALARADDLARRTPLRALRERARSLADEDERDARRQFSAIREARAASVPRTPDALLAGLGVPALRQRLASADSLSRGSAARRLANIWAWIAFYEPRAFLAAGQAQRAASSLRAAALIEPLGGDSCGLARRVAAQLPREEAAALPPCA